MEPVKFDYTLWFTANTGYQNPGPGVGSYTLKSEITHRKVYKPEIELCAKDQKLTNIQADYTCLLMALEKLISLIEHGNSSPQNYNLLVIGYSQVVIKQLDGSYSVGSNPDLFDAVLARLNQFVSWQAVWLKKAEVLEQMGA
jgi:ribonuclease HI